MLWRCGEMASGTRVIPVGIPCMVVRAQPRFTAMTNGRDNQLTYPEPGPVSAGGSGQGDAWCLRSIARIIGMGSRSHEGKPDSAALISSPSFIRSTCL